jgi:hypothetical protein
MALEGSSAWAISSKAAFSPAADHCLGDLAAFQYVS